MAGFRLQTRCNQIMKGLESEADEQAVNVADTEFLSRRMGQ